MGILFKLTSCALLFVSGLLWKYALLKNKNYNVIIYRSLFTIGIQSILFLFFSYHNFGEILNHIKSVSFTNWTFAIFISMISFWGLFFFTKFLQDSRYIMSVCIGPIASLTSVFVSIFIFREVFTLKIAIVTALMLFAIVFHQRQVLRGVSLSKEMLMVVLSAVFWGMSFPLMVIPIKIFGALFYSILLEGCVIFSSLIILLLSDKKIIPSIGHQKNIYIYALLGLLVAFGSYLNNVSLVQIPIILNIVIGLLFEVLTIIVGFYVYNEKIKKQDWVLIMIIITAFGIFLF